MRNTIDGKVCSKCHFVKNKDVFLSKNTSVLSGTIIVVFEFCHIAESHLSTVYYEVIFTESSTTRYRKIEK